MKKFKVTIIVEVENQSVEDMEFNAQGYIKHDIEDNALYIEDIEEIVVEEWLEYLKDLRKPKWEEPLLK